MFCLLKALVLLTSSISATIRCSGQKTTCSGAPPGHQDRGQNRVSFLEEGRGTGGESWDPGLDEGMALLRRGVCKGCPKRGEGVWGDPGTGNLGYPNLGKEKGWDAGQKWEAGEELGRLAGDLELSLGVQGSTGRGEQGKVCMGGGLSAQAQSEGGAEAMF